MINQIKNLGFVFSLFITIVSIVIVYLIPSFNLILVGLILGIIIGNTINFNSNISNGFSWTSSKMLELSIIFLAFGMSFSHIQSIGISYFAIIIVVVIIVLAATILLSNQLKCPSKVAYLVGFGTGICGSSAIAALSPTFKDDKEDIGISLAVVNFYGVLGMLFVPMIAVYFSLNETETSLLIGGSLHAVGNVAGAGFGINDKIGELSITIKLARVALLTPMLIGFNYFITKTENRNWKNLLILPWYLYTFIGITIVMSFITLPKEILNILSEIGKIILTLAMVAIGLKISFKKMLVSGRRGLLFGFIIFAIQVLLLLLFINLI